MHTQPAMGCVAMQKIPANTFKVKNIIDRQRSVQNGLMEVTATDLLYTDSKMQIQRQWPLKYLRRYGCDRDVFSFEAGRKCPGGEGLYAFSTPQASVLFDLVVRNINQGNLQPLGDLTTASLPSPPVLLTPGGIPPPSADFQQPNYQNMDLTGRHLVIDTVGEVGGAGQGSTKGSPQIPVMQANYQNINVGLGSVVSITSPGVQQSNYQNITCSTGNGPMVVHGDPMAHYAHLDLTGNCTSTPREPQQTSYMQLEFNQSAVANGNGSTASPSAMVMCDQYSPEATSLDITVSGTVNGSDRQTAAKSGDDSTTVNYGVLDFSAMEAIKTLHIQHEQEHLEKEREREIEQRRQRKILSSHKRHKSHPCQHSHSSTSSMTEPPKPSRLQLHTVPSSTSKGSLSGGSSVSSQTLLTESLQDHTKSPQSGTSGSTLTPTPEQNNTYQNLVLGQSSPQIPVTQANYQNVNINVSLGSVVSVTSPGVQQSNYQNITCSTGNGPMVVHSDPMAHYANLDLTGNCTSTPREPQQTSYMQLEFNQSVVANGNGSTASPSAMVTRDQHSPEATSLDITVSGTVNGSDRQTAAKSGDNSTMVNYGVLNFGAMEAIKTLHIQREQEHLEKEREREIEQRQQREKSSSHKRHK